MTDGSRRISKSVLAWTQANMAFAIHSQIRSLTLHKMNDNENGKVKLAESHTELHHVHKSVWTNHLKTAFEIKSALFLDSDHANSRRNMRFMSND